MTEILAFSGIRRYYDLWSKLNFQDLGAVRNLNASIPDPVAGLSTAAQNGFGDFGGFIMPAKSAMIGSLSKDWGSSDYGPRLALSSEALPENIQQIQVRQPIQSPAQLQEDIQQKKRQLREAIPISVEEVLEDFEPLFEVLKLPFNRTMFEQEYNSFYNKYKSENNQQFQTNVIIPLKEIIDKILQKPEISEDDIPNLKEKCCSLFDAALRIKNKTDHYYWQHGVVKYNEIHLPPLLQLMEGFFIIDDFDYTVDEIKVYNIIKDVQEILFQSEEYHTQENFDALTPDQKKSFKIFFEITSLKDLKLPEYIEKIDTFFENQKIYVDGIISNLEIEREKLKEELPTAELLSLIIPNTKVLADLLAEPVKKNQELLKSYLANQETLRQIQQTDRLISIYRACIDRKKLPDLLLEKPFEIYLLDSQSQELQTKKSIREKIEGLKNGRERIMLALQYARLGALDVKEVWGVITITIEDLKDLANLVKDNLHKIRIITAALEQQSIQIEGQDLINLANLVGDDSHKTSIIKIALKKQSIKIDLKDLAKLVGDDSHKTTIIITAVLEQKSMQINVQDLKDLAKLFGDDSHKTRIITAVLEQQSIQINVQDLKDLANLVGGDWDKKSIITAALKKQSIQIEGQDLKDLAKLVKDDRYKTEIITAALEQSLDTRASCLVSCFFCCPFKNYILSL